MFIEIIKSQWNRMVVRYAVVGGSVAAADVVFFYIFAGMLGFNYLWINAIGFVLGTLLNYLISIQLVFESGVRFRRSGEIMLIFVISATSLILSQFLLYYFVELLQLHLLLSKILTLLIVFLWNYLSRKHFVFRESLAREME